MAQRSVRLQQQTTADPLSSLRYWLVGSTLLAVVGVLADFRPLLTSQPEPAVDTEICQEVIHPESRLSRDRLSQLLSIPERSSREAVQQLIAAPFCTLPPLTVRAGAVAEREAYPLEFDPGTWFILLYEEDEYVGYDFSFRH
ncbi:hypothetical protein [Almyronema epifaneia]|uniref:DUF3192 domain-containing protein n=1 Tax=Almyronema epifaneia S1 TaxID=2991925 RepID=A0ABW6I919_9CYAN